MIITLYILRNLIVPLLFSSLSLMGIFVLQFLMRFADKLVGKGLDTWTIVQLIIYNLAWMVVLVVPMAVLIATLMAFGGMSQNSEITILKAAGVSIKRMLIAPVILGLSLFYFLIYFNNDVLPDANHKVKNLTYEITQKKPTLSLIPNVFLLDINNFAILARKVDPLSNRLYDLTLYDYSDPVKLVVVTAKEGNLYFTPDREKLIMDLNSGEIHESDAAQSGMYRKLKYERHKILMDASQFSLKQMSSSERSDRELSSSAMQEKVDSLQIMYNEFYSEYKSDMHKYFYGDSLGYYLGGSYKIDSKAPYYYDRLIDKVKNLKNIANSNRLRLEFVDTQKNSFKVEIHKKYSIPAACLIFVLIGAPLGIMTGKGGFGMAASVSLFFFLVYWAFLIGGEKLADRGLISPFFGMWTANIILGGAGIYLMYKSSKESIIINFSFLKKILPKKLRTALEQNNENS